MRCPADYTRARDMFAVTGVSARVYVVLCWLRLRRRCLCRHDLIADADALTITLFTPHYAAAAMMMPLPFSCQDAAAYDADALMPLFRYVCVYVVTFTPRHFHYV